MSGRAELLALVAAEADRDVGAEARAMSAAIAARHKDCIQATLFYGSCLRPPNPDDPREVGPGGTDERVMDFYAVVDDLRRANRGALSTLGNRLLPPNVFFFEVAHGAGRIRCKYAVVSLEQLRRRTAAATAENYFWGRFCQPTAVPYARNAAVRAAVVAALAEASASMAAAAAPLMDGPFAPRDLWVRALAESYRAELRAEGPERARHVHDADPARYAAFAAPALAAAGIATERLADGRLRTVSGAASPADAEAAWARRRRIGKTLSVLRLAKAAFTFDGGVDYILWKIERHSGVRVAMTPWQRRHPLLSAPVVALRAWRQGAFR